MSPRVTIAMPVFNGEKYLGAAIESILAQDYGDFEFIITDNASQDATKELCLEFAKRDSRIRYVVNPRNLGAALNYNRGFELARGEFIKWCAHDDLISPNFVSACLAVLQNDAGASLAFGRTKLIDSKGTEIADPDPKEMQSILDDQPERRFHRALINAGTCFPIFGLFRMDTLRKSTLHRRYYGSDRSLIAEIALLGRCLLVDGATLYNRDHPSRSIRMADHAMRSKWQDTSASRSASMEHVFQLVHLIEIACRHPDVASPILALLQVSKRTLTLKQFGRIALDVCRHLSPTAAASLRRVYSSSADNKKISAGT